MYLSDKDVGSWINSKNMDAEDAIKNIERRSTKAFEQFDSEEDCDIIPYDNEQLAEL